MLNIIQYYSNKCKKHKNNINKKILKNNLTKSYDNFMKTKKLFLTVIILFITGIMNAQSILYQKVRDRTLQSRQKINTFNIFEKAGAEALRISIPEELRKNHLTRVNKSALNEVIKAQPSIFTLQVPVNDIQNIEVTLVENKKATDNFQVFDGETGRKLAYEKAVHYKGIVEGDENSIVAFSFFRDKVMGQITANGKSYTVGQYRNGLHIVYEENDLQTNYEFECGTVSSDSDYVAEIAQEASFQSKTAAAVKCIDLKVDVDHDIYLDKGLSGSVDYIAALFNQSFILYENEGITMSLKEVFVWTTASPYTFNASNTTNDALEMLQSYQAHTGAFNAHLSHLVSYRSNGGYAAGFNGLCNNNPDNRKCFSQIYSSFKNVPNFSWSVMVITHEMGHLLGSRHTHACVWNGNSTAIDGCYAVEGNCARPGNPVGGGTIMSYCHTQNVGINFTNGFGPQPGNLIRSRVSNAACLSNCSASCYDGIKNGNEVGVDCGGTCENICPCENDMIPPAIENYTNGLLVSCDDNGHPDGSIANPFTHLYQTSYVQNAGIYHFNINGSVFSSYVNSNGDILIAVDFGNGAGTLPSTSALMESQRGILNPIILSKLTEANEIRLSTSTGSVNLTSSDPNALKRIFENRALVSSVEDIGILQNFTGNAGPFFNTLTCYNTTKYTLAEKVVHLCGDVNGFTWIPSQNLVRENYWSGQVSATTSFNLWLKANPNPNQCLHKTNVIVCDNIIPDFTGNNLIVNDNCASKDQLRITQTPAAGTSIQGPTEVVVTVYDPSGNSTSINFTVIKDNQAPVISTATNGLPLTCDLSLEPKGTANDPFISLKQARRVASEGIYYFNLNGQTFSSVVSSNGEILVAQDYGNGTGNLPQLTQFSADTRGILSPQILASLTDAAQIRIKSSSGKVNVTSNNATVLSRLRASKTLIVGSTDLALAQSFSGTGSAYFSTTNCVNNIGTNLDGNIVYLCGNYNGFTWIPSWPLQREVYQLGEVSDTTRFTIWVQPNISDTDCFNGEAVLLCDGVIPDLTGSNIIANDNCSDNSQLTVTQSPAQGTAVSGTSEVTITVTDNEGNSSQKIVKVKVDEQAPVIKSVSNGLTLVCDPSLRPKGTENDPFVNLKQAAEITTEGVYYFNINGQLFSTVVNNKGEILVAQDFGNGIGNLPQLQSFSADTRGLLSPNILATLTDAVQIRIKSSSGKINVVSGDATLLSRLRSNQSLIARSSDINIAKTFQGTGSNYFTSITCNSPLTSLHTNIVHMCGNVNGFHWVPNVNYQRESSNGGEVSNTTRFTIWVKADKADCAQKGVDIKCSTVVPDLLGSNVISQDQCDVILTQNPQAGTQMQGDKVTVTITATDKAGNSSKSTIDVFKNCSETTAENELQNRASEAKASPEMILYPNPATTIINIDLVDYEVRKDSKISIYSSSGQLIKEMNINTNRVSIPVRDLVSGTYIIVLKNPDTNEPLTKKFIKK